MTLDYGADELKVFVRMVLGDLLLSLQIGLLQDPNALDDGVVDA